VTPEPRFPRSGLCHDLKKRHLRLESGGDASTSI
jgi:hypothetical protein